MRFEIMKFNVLKDDIEVMVGDVSYYGFFIIVEGVSEWIVY